jgi:hypothetical protein
MLNKMIKKIKELIRENRANNNKIYLQTKELEWANIFHDSIRGKKHIDDLGLNIGRWAGSYPFFYVLNRILSDYCPSSILEFGLGESSKFISTYIENYIPNCQHIIIEQNELWAIEFKNRFNLSKKSSIIFCELETQLVNGFEVKSYSNLESKITNDFDLYIVDGPFGSPRFSRYDIVLLVERFQKDKDFVILFDDTNRDGEKDTLKEILLKLKNKNIKYHVGHYEGNKRVTLICSEKYIYLTSL